MTFFPTTIEDADDLDDLDDQSLVTPMKEKRVKKEAKKAKQKGSKPKTAYQQETEEFRNKPKSRKARSRNKK